MQKTYFSYIGKAYNSDIQTHPEPLLRKALNHMLNFQVAAYVHQIQQGVGVCLELPSWINHCSTG